MFKQVLTDLRRRLSRLGSGRARDDDPWERIPVAVPIDAFGPGSRHDFAWYFEGESAIAAGTVDEIQEWLLGCEYTRDPDLFQEPDFWQHPRTFERLRQGDCEDHALWAWRKLVELGVDAEFVCGRMFSPDDARGEGGYHAWVVFRRAGNTYVMEATCKIKDRMIRPLAEVRQQYVPSLSVDGKRERYAYVGGLKEPENTIDCPE